MTERERQIEDFLSRNLTMREIAERLDMPRREAAVLVKAFIEEHGDPVMRRIDAHIEALRKIDFRRPSRA